MDRFRDTQKTLKAEPALKDVNRDVSRYGEDTPPV